MYFVSKIEERAGLKISQHTRANRKGPNMHQIVRTASGVIVGIYFEIDRDSEYSCTLNLIKSQLATSHDAGRVIKRCVRS